MENNSSFVSEETIYNEQPAAETISEKTADSKDKFGWKEVMIGAVPGIALGALGTFITTEAVAANDNAIGEIEAEVEDEAQEQDSTAATHNGPSMSASATINEVAAIAHDVNDDMTFSQAYAEARAEVGPGGVFTWHGNTYSTYSQDEWSSMDGAARQAYAHSVSAAYANDHEVDQNTEQITDHAVNHTDDHAETAASGSEAVDGGSSDGDLEISVLGVGTIETVDGGQVIAAPAEVDGHDAMFIDSDSDGMVDVLLVDLNDDGEVQEEEVFDASESGISDHDLALMASMNEVAPETDLYAQAPDYTNNADTDGLA